MVEPPFFAMDAVKAPLPAQPLIPDFDLAERFLELLDPEADVFTFQFFDDTEEPTGQKQTWIKGTLEQHWDNLVQRNLAGQGIFVSINETSPQGRGNDHVTAIRAVWQDDDEGRQGDYPLLPSMVIESSPGKYHRYWLLVSPNPDVIQEHRPIMERMVKDYGADNGAKDLARVLRLPGLFNMKSKYTQPHLATFQQSIGDRYSWKEVTMAFPPYARGNGESGDSGIDMDEDGNIPQGGRDNSLFKIACAMRGKGDGFKSILGELLKVNATQCSPPMAYQQVEKIARQGGKHPKGSPPLLIDPSALLGKTKQVAISDMASYTLTDAEFQELEDVKMLVPNLIPSGHIINIVGEAGSGKTTITMHFCKDMANRGVTIWYINADCAPDAAKAYHQAVTGMDAFHLILPDLKRVSMEEILGTLTGKSDAGDQLENTVIVFDTLKKAVDMMSKKGLREFYKWARRLTALNATIILLGHTNKHRSPDGSLIFEGTGDIRNDTDELFYLEAAEQDDGSKIVTMTPDKSRAFDLKPATFTIHPDWTVTRNDVVIDTRAIIEAQERRKKDQSIIDDILESIEKLDKQGMAAIQKRIIDDLKGKINHKTITRVIDQQTGSAWRIERGVNHSKIVRPL